MAEAQHLERCSTENRSNNGKFAGLGKQTEIHDEGKLFSGVSEHLLIDGEELTLLPFRQSDVETCSESEASSEGDCDSPGD